MVDEDNDNRQWGHSHYKSGINTILLTWGSVGSVDMAFKLLAAGLHISACARHICYKRRIHIPADSTLIADVYLERLTNRLVQVWQKADGVCSSFHHCSLHFLIYRVAYGRIHCTVCCTIASPSAFRSPSPSSSSIPDSDSLPPTISTSWAGAHFKPERHFWAA